MQKVRQFLTKYKKEVVAISIFIVSLCIFSISYAFAAVEPVRSIVIQSEHTDFASSEAGSWQVTKSGYWTNYAEAEVKFEVDTTKMTDYLSKDVIFVLDVSGSMVGERLERVKQDSKELLDDLLTNTDNRAALITFDSSSTIVSGLSNDKELLTTAIDNLQIAGATNYYQALVNVDNILKDYQKEENRELIVLFLTDGYPNVGTPNEEAQYQYLKQAYPYITINGIQYEMGSNMADSIKAISDEQYVADINTLNNVLFEACEKTAVYDTFQIIDYINNDYFTLRSMDDITVSEGSVELTGGELSQEIIWTLDGMKSGSKATLTMRLEVFENRYGEGGVYPTNNSTEVVSKIETKEEEVRTTSSPILQEAYQVIYDGNAPEGCTVTNVPETLEHPFYESVEINPYGTTPSCSGYEFKGWEVVNDDVKIVGNNYFIMPEEDVTIRAEWSKIEITKSMNGTVYVEPAPVMKEYYYGQYAIDQSVFTYSTDDYHSDRYRDNITSIVTKDNIDIPSTAIESWDVSRDQNGSVIAYIEDDGRGEGTYKVTIGGKGGVGISPNASSLFAGFSKLETLDLTYLDTRQATHMGFYLDSANICIRYGMFSFNPSLKNIIFGKLCSTKQVTDMSWLFYMCGSLPTIDLSGLDTSNVTNMSYMFMGCTSLNNPNLDSFNTSQVTNMDSMFFYCHSLSNINLSNFDTSQVTNMGSMFYGCSSLTNLNLSNFDTSKVTNMYAMFYECSSLTNLDMRNATFNATSYSSMFSYVPNGINIIVKDATAKTWIESRLRVEGVTGTVTIAST